MQKHMIIHPARTLQSGFSLLEITIVLAVLAVVLAGVLPYLTEATKSREANVTIERLDKIEEAILSYYLENNKIPCPANITLPSDDSAFGATDLTAGCTAANASAGDARFGGVPTQELEIPDEYAFDGWGRRIDYHVDQHATTGTFTSGTWLIINNGSANIATTAGYVLVSHGPNGHGAYMQAGGTQRMDSDSLNSHELENCNNGLAAPCSAPYNNIFIKKSAKFDTAGDENDFFDDVVRYRTRVMIKNAFGGAALLPETCSDGEKLQWYDNKPSLPGTAGWDCAP